MLVVGDNHYPLCLLDTSVVSEMVKDDASPLLNNFFRWACADTPMFLPSLTIYTLIELRRRPALFARFIDRFRNLPLPCVLLKGYAHLLEEEVASYPDPSAIDPCAIAFTPLGGEGNQLANLPWLLDLYADKEKTWSQAGPEVVDGMVSLVPNYPPERDAYTAREVRHFVWLASFQQLAYHDETNDFVKQKLNQDQLIDVDAFPSLKAMAYTVFYKFYTDSGRRPSHSDAFDVLIAAALPYVEAVITENHQAEALRKTKQRDAFLGGLKVFTLRGLRDGLASRP